MPKRVKWVTAKEYAASRGYSPATVNQWCRDKRLKKAAKKEGRTWKIRPDLADSQLGVSEPVGDGTESVREYASRCGCSIENIKKLIKRGSLEGAWSKNAAGHFRIDPEKADELRKGKTRKKQPAKAPAEIDPKNLDGEIQADADIEEAQRVEKVWKARTARLKHLEAEGELINLAKARNAVFGAAKEFRERLETLANKLRDKLAGEDDPVRVHAILEEEHHQALEAFADLTEKGELRREATEADA